MNAQQNTTHANARLASAHASALGSALERKYARARETASHFSLSLATLWRFTHRPNFPAPLKPSPGVTLFDIPAVEAWMRGAH